MTKVRFKTWSPGLDKVQLTKLIRDTLGVPLNEAHGAVNRLVDGELVEFSIPSSVDAQRLAREATALGAETECVSIPKSTTAAS